MKQVVLVRASPHPDGVTDRVSDLLATGLRAEGHPPQILTLRSHRIRPCTGCGHCAPPPHVCPLDAGTDQAGALLHTLAKAHLLIFCAPIYFYALPAQAKALVDRAQRFWMQRRFESSTLRTETAPPPRPSQLVLVAGRTHGPHLFSGALRTLRYFLQALGRTVTDCHELRGLENTRDLSRQNQVARDLLELGKTLAKGLDHTAEGPMDTQGPPNP